MKPTYKSYKIVFPDQNSQSSVIKDLKKYRPRMLELFKKHKTGIDDFIVVPGETRDTIKITFECTPDAKPDEYLSPVLKKIGVQFILLETE